LLPVVAVPARRTSASYILSLHDALPICPRGGHGGDQPRLGLGGPVLRRAFQPVREPGPPQRQRGAEAALPAGTDQRRRGGGAGRSEEHTSELQPRENLVCRLLLEKKNTQ